MTANVRPEDRERCLAAGADACVSKPIAAEDLRRRVEEVLAVAERERSIEVHERGTTAPPASQDQRAEESSSVEAPCCEALVLDHMALRTNFGDSLPELGPRLARVLVEEQPRQLDSLRAALASSEVEAARRFVHSLKSSFAQFGATEAAGFAARMEDWARVGDLEKCRRGEPTLAAQIDALREALARDGWWHPPSEPVVPVPCAAGSVPCEAGSLRESGGHAWRPS